MKNEEAHLNVMDLFAGIGGAAYAGHLIRNWRTVCYVEWDKYCQEVIQARIREGIFDDAPIWDDVKTFDGYPWAGFVDIITAGFPCQSFSVAGKRRGESDERNMWPETLRVIDEVQPRFAFLENVPGLISSGYFNRIIGDLTEIGYDARWIIISAADVGAPHLRKRLWILAHPISLGQYCWGNGTGRETRRESDFKDSESGEVVVPAIDRNSGKTRGFHGQEQGQKLHGMGQSIIPGEISWWDIDPADIPDTEGTERLRGGEQEENWRGDSEPGRQGQDNVSHTDKEGLWNSQGCSIDARETGDGTSGCSNGRTIEPVMGRMADGVPDRGNRIKGLGNAWVPAVAATAWNILTGGIYDN